MRYYGESNVPGAPGNNFRTLEYVPLRDGTSSFQPMPYYGGGMGIEPLSSPAVRFNPNDLNVQPLPGHNETPGYSPFNMEQERDRFILHSPKSGVAALPSPMSQESFEQRVDERRLDNRLKQMGYSSLLQYLKDTNQLPPPMPKGINLGV